MNDTTQLPNKCAVCRDLMPLCIDGTASPASQRKVDKHTAACEACAIVYQEMQTNVDLNLPDEEESQQFDTAVKKVRHRHTWRKLRNVLLGVFLALALCGGGAYGYYWYFLEELPLPTEQYQLELYRFNSLNKTSDPVFIKAALPDHAKLHIKVQPHGFLMDSSNALQPNLVMYIWASTTRNAPTGTSTARNYYAFDCEKPMEDTFIINGADYAIGTIYQGAEMEDKALLYKEGMEELALTFDFSGEIPVLHSVDSISVP